MNKTIETSVVITLLAAHFVADFILQTDKQAKGKSKNLTDLLSHVLTYSFFISVVSVFLLPIHLEIIGVYLPLAFFFITFICHAVTDYFTSRINSKLWSDGKVHWFFVSVGFDQLLHYIQLLLTYNLLS